MGLHIYSGSLVRFFTNDWENEIQQLARKHGIEYQTSFPEGEPDWPTRNAAIEHLSWMRSTLAARSVRRSMSLTLGLSARNRTAIVTSW
jgi:hypothetical protein